MPVNIRPFKSSEHINEKKGMDHILKPLQLPFRFGKNGAKGKYCNFATFNRIVDTKTCVFQTEPSM